jgi:hypothetical protein
MCHFCLVIIKTGLASGAHSVFHWVVLVSAHEVSPCMTGVQWRQWLRVSGDE